MLGLIHLVLEHGIKPKTSWVGILPPKTFEITPNRTLKTPLACSTTFYPKKRFSWVGPDFISADPWRGGPQPC